MAPTPRDIAEHLAEVREKIGAALWDQAAAVPPVTGDPFVDVANVVKAQGEQLAVVTEVLLTVMRDLEELARGL
jgi:hypothetical protein